MKTAIVIVTYNRINLLKECIDHALKQVAEYTELVVVNNKSTDGTREFLASIQNPRVHCIHEDNNIGGAGGFHDGLKFAVENTDCDWFLLIDDDAMIDENYLHNIAINIVPSISAYAGTVKVGSQIDISHRLIRNNGPVGLDSYNRESFNCDFATFCGLLVSRELVNRIGYPRKDFFIWHDDTEYCYRMDGVTSINVITGAILNHKTLIADKTNKPIKDNWKWYYGFRNELVIYKTNGMTKQYYKKLCKLIGKAIQYRFLSFFSNTHKNEYRYNSDLRFNAIRDMKNKKMGKSENY